MAKINQVKLRQEADSAEKAGRFGKRPHCIMRGFCLLGCKVGAKSSILVSHIPDAVAYSDRACSASPVSRARFARAKVSRPRRCSRFRAETIS